MKRLESISVRHDKAAYEKGRAAKDWVPEYKPESIISPDKSASVVADKYTHTSLAMITEVWNPPHYGCFKYQGDPVDLEKSSSLSAAELSMSCEAVIGY